jgi:hypothetical protein
MQNYVETSEQPVITAEFDYFRLAREKWELMLTRLIQMGVSHLSLTIPWGFHEITAGQVDLQGNTLPRRDLIGLLDLCAALKLDCLLRLGPLHPEQGLLHQGLPGWLARHDDQLEAALPEAAKRWFKTLSQALVVRQGPAGPIFALSLAGQAEPTLQALPAQWTEVKWPIWLRKRYKGIEALNAAYGSDYHSVSEVPFPQGWSQAATPLEADARAFLAETGEEGRESYSQLLAEAGWKIPIQTPDNEEQPLPLHLLSLAEPTALTRVEASDGIVILQQPIQVEPDPLEIGRGPVWAEGAPIRPDGYLRRKFWTVRAHIWPRRFPQAILAENLLTIPGKGGLLITSAQEAPLKINLPKGAKPEAYRLSLSGALSGAEGLAVNRGKLSGLYPVEDDKAQTDCLLVIDQPATSLTGFTLTYLQRLLQSQAEALAQGATLASQLGQALAPPPEKTEQSRSQAPTRPLPYTLAEARRGLKEADAALRKAMASVGGLEAGFGTILGKPGSETAQAAAPAPAISPEIFEGVAREVLHEAGATCLALAPRLDSAAKSVRQTVENPEGFTAAQYQAAYTAAIEAAQTAREQLLSLIERLRTEIAAEELPLVAWRVHDQLQALAEGLRWGVMRG